MQGLPLFLESHLVFDARKTSRSGQLLTITLKEAQSKIWRIRGLTRSIDKRRLEKLDTLANIRNGILHAAVLNVEDQRDLLVEYLRSSEELYNERLDGKGGALARWGAILPLVSALIDEPCNFLRERVEKKKLIATWRRQEIIDIGEPSDGGYDSTVNVLIVERLNEVFLKFGDREGSIIHAHCPVCKEDDVGAYTGTIIEKSGEAGELLQVSEFICDVCELHLPTVEEMEIAGVSLTLELDFND
jgi:hypothetical protein